jgi:hypothetical protein
MNIVAMSIFYHLLSVHSMYELIFMFVTSEFNECVPRYSFNFRPKANLCNSHHQSRDLSTSISEALGVSQFFHRVCPKPLLMRWTIISKNIKIALTLHQKPVLFGVRKSAQKNETEKLYPARSPQKVSSQVTEPRRSAKNPIVNHREKLERQFSFSLGSVTSGTDHSLGDQNGQKQQ